MHSTASTAARTLDINRRSLLLAGGMAGVGALGMSTSTAAASRSSSSDPVSMAMHLHASLSEGIASMDAHLNQAERLGVDVVWWTDHDFRKTAFGYRTAVGFDGLHEPAGGQDLTWVPVTTGDLADTGLAFVDLPVNPDEPGKKMQVRGQSSYADTWASYRLEATVQNFLYSTSYSDTTLVLDVLPQAASDETRIVIEVVSSYRPARGGRPAGQYRLEYRLGGEVGRWTEEGGLLGVIGLEAGALDTWRRLQLDLRADHAALWPDTVADDASLWRLRLGVLARNGAVAQVLFDRLRFERTRDLLGSGTTLLKGAIAEYRKRYPGVKQFDAAEISLVLHLNAFGGDGTLPDYPGRYAVKDGSLEAQRDMIRWLHHHGATVGINHPLDGIDGPTDLARRLVTTRGQHADLIEIGTGSSVDNLAGAFDVASRNAVFLTANGSTDDHDGINWSGDGRRWLTSVWSMSSRRADLCAALEAGRAWFYDPRYWSGTFDLRLEGTTKMGGVTFTRNKLLNLVVMATGLPEASTLEVVVGRCDRAGANRLEPVNRISKIPARKVRGGRWSQSVDRGVGVYVRAAVRSELGDIIGFSNPVWALPMRLRGEVSIPAARR